MVSGFCGKVSCFSGVDGGCKRICRGRPMCRPGHGSSRDPFTGGHIGPPLRGVEGVPETRKLVRRRTFPAGWGGARPLHNIGGPYGSSWKRCGEGGISGPGTLRNGRITMPLRGEGTNPHGQCAHQPRNDREGYFSARPCHRSCGDWLDHPLSIFQFLTAPFPRYISEWFFEP